MFSNDDLKKMIVPLFLEQLLVMLVGIADTVIISYAGEAAVSGVSLVNQFNTIFIYLFSALAAGGAVVISQYIGKQEKEQASLAASQLLMFSTVFSIVISVIVLIGSVSILRLMFGRVEEDVMQACVTYLRISAYSFPAIAIYNAGAALCRSLGKTSITMKVSMLSNVINVVGNLIGVFVLKAGVAGVAWPSMIARTFSAVAITVICSQSRMTVYYRPAQVFTWKQKILRSVLGIAIPNGIESGIFQFVKVALSSIVALFGTYQIAANGVAQSIWSLAALAGVAMGPVFITVIGQCMGAGDTEMADAYFRKLCKLTVVISVCWNAFVLLMMPLILRCYALSPETKHLVWILVIIHNVFNALAFPYSGALSSGLRAAGDVRYTMIVSITTTLGVRLILSWLLGMVFGMGVIGVALAMACNWTMNAILFIIRQRSGKWKKFRVIEA